MRSNQTFGIQFWLRHSQKKNDRYPVYTRITVNKSRCELCLKKFLTLAEWDCDRMEARPISKELIEFNNYLVSLKARFISIYHNLIISEQPITADIIKRIFLNPGMERQPLTLLALVKEHNTMVEKILKHGSLKNYYTTKKYLERFLEQKYKSGDIFLKLLNYEFIASFEYFIRTTPIRKEDPCSTNGVMKHMERLKKISAWAVKLGYLLKDPFESYQLKFKPGNREYLTLEELQKLEAQVFYDAMLIRVKELFIFSCYTGLAYCDIIALTWDNIERDNHGELWINYKREKTDAGTLVPLLGPALAILEKHKSDQIVPGPKAVFAWVSNQCVNKSLKIIAAVCGIRKRLTFHMARHTFATTITLMNDIPIETISKMLGHSKISTTMLYAKVTQLKIDRDIRALREKINNYECNN